MGSGTEWNACDRWTVGNLDPSEVERRSRGIG